MTRRYRIKSYRTDSHVIQKRYFGFLWLSPLGLDVRYMHSDDALNALRNYVLATNSYPQVTTMFTEQEILNGSVK
ncbi:MAG: hypothetical protein [Caudoviricetes sp.]|nr:MAG: hypothetical protein [Caudoviricetes sp.]